jgi:hypothetical protein
MGTCVRGKRRFAPRPLPPRARHRQSHHRHLGGARGKRLSLEDALALTLLYRDQDPARFERAVLRWHARFCVETRSLTTQDAQLALSALIALRGPRPDAGARALVALFDSLVMTEAAAVMHDWLSRRPAG